MLRVKRNKYSTRQTHPLLHITCPTIQKQQHREWPCICSSNWFANILMVLYNNVWFVVVLLLRAVVALHATHIKTTRKHVYCTPGIIIIINHHHRHYRWQYGSIIEFTMYTNSIIGVGKLYVTWFYKFYCGSRPLNTQSAPL